MFRHERMRRGALLAVGMLLLGVPWGDTQAQNPQRVMPKLEPVAETRLLMEGIAHPNYRGVERLLKQKPADVQSWTFARGQALLIAEAANLLMLRPPRNQGQPVWFERAMELRKSASDLGRAVAERDFQRSKAGVVSVANSCNRCHQSFRVPVEIAPFADPPGVQKVRLEP
jgi:hypothetical protein